MKLDNLDRQLLGYLSERPQAMYGEIAGVFAVPKIAVDKRIQALCRGGYLEAHSEGRLLLSDRGRQERSFAFELPLSQPTESFDWEALYIPENFEG